MWAIEQLLVRARILGATQSDHYLMPSRVSGSSMTRLNLSAGGDGEPHGESLRRMLDSKACDRTTSDTTR
jgi:hypothetical protein